MNLDKFKVEELSVRESQNNNGGIIILMSVAFVQGMYYGYAKEKFASGQW